MSAISGKNFIQMMQPVLGLPDKIRSLKIEAAFNTAVIVNVEYFGHSEKKLKKENGRFVVHIENAGDGMRRKFSKRVNRCAK